MSEIDNFIEYQEFFEDVMEDEALTNAELEDMYDYFEEDVYDDPYHNCDRPVNEDRYER